MTPVATSYCCCCSRRRCCCSSCCGGLASCHSNHRASLASSQDGVPSARSSARILLDLMLISLSNSLIVVKHVKVFITYTKNNFSLPSCLYKSRITEKSCERISMNLYRGRMRDWQQLVRFRWGSDPDHDADTEFFKGILRPWRGGFLYEFRQVSCLGGGLRLQSASTLFYHLYRRLFRHFRSSDLWRLKR